MLRCCLESLIVSMLFPCLNIIVSFRNTYCTHRLCRKCVSARTRALFSRTPPLAIRVMVHTRTLSSRFDCCSSFVFVVIIYLSVNDRRNAQEMEAVTRHRQQTRPRCHMRKPITHLKAPRSCFLSTSTHCFLPAPFNLAFDWLAPTITGTTVLQL